MRSILLSTILGLGTLGLWLGGSAAEAKAQGIFVPNTSYVYRYSYSPYYGSVYSTSRYYTPYYGSPTYYYSSWNRYPYPYPVYPTYSYPTYPVYYPTYYPPLTPYSPPPTPVPSTPVFFGQ